MAVLQEIDGNIHDICDRIFLAFYRISPSSVGRLFFRYGRWLLQLFPWFPFFLGDLRSFISRYLFVLFFPHFSVSFRLTSSYHLHSTLLFLHFSFYSPLPYLALKSFNPFLTSSPSSIPAPPLPSPSTLSNPLHRKRNPHHPHFRNSYRNIIETED